MEVYSTNSGSEGTGSYELFTTKKATVEIELESGTFPDVLETKVDTPFTVTCAAMMGRPEPVDFTW